MKSTAEKVEKNKVKIEIQVDAQDFEKAMNKSYIKNKGRFVIPGFRKGKAPRAIIERYYGEAVFYEDAFNEIFPEAYSKAIEENNIEPVDQPELDIKQIGGGQNLIFTASVTVKPEVELGQYKGIEVEKLEYNVTDEDVESAIKAMQERYARWNTVEDAVVKEGDLVTLDFSGTVDGEPIEGGSAERYPLEIGSGSFIPGFEEQLIGLKPGDEKEINVTFPEDYGNEDLKGKEAVFKVKIHEVKEKELPELDDEFAKDVSEFDTLDEYRTSVRERLENQVKQEAKNLMEAQLIARIADATEIDIPEVMVERQIDNILMDLELSLYYRGMNLQRYLEAINTSMEDFRAQYRDQAYTRVKNALILEKIAQVENIEATEEDVDKELEELAKQRQITLEEAREQYADNLDDIKNTIQIRKTIDFLMDNAVFVERMEPETEDGEPGEDKQQPEDENQDKEAQAEEQKAADNEPEA
ncbi:MAG: trigger factor [Clostridiales bacterium]|nr:trigger factor [Clostridiales bacterium]